MGFNERTLHNDKNLFVPNLNVGDILIIDTRLTHRGLIKEPIDTKRILVSFAFGKNNVFTDNFEKGTITRQNKYDPNEL